MIVEAHDWRPPSLLAGERWTFGMIAGGLGFASWIIVAAVAIVVVGQRVADALAEEDEHAILERDIVAAEFVRLGHELDPKKLPNRRVPRKSTAPLRDLLLSKQTRDPADVPDMGPPPPDAVNDIVRRFGDRIHLFAEIAEAVEQEGDPNGIEEGTATTAREGDLYAGQVKLLFQRGWNVPTTIPRDEIEALRVTVVVEIGEDLRVTGHRVATPSGNPLFDQSVIDRVEEVRLSGTTLPDPPAEVDGLYRGAGIRLRFDGRDAR